SAGQRPSRTAGVQAGGSSAGMRVEAPALAKRKSRFFCEKIDIPSHRNGCILIGKEASLMQITRRYTVEGQDPFASFKFAPRTSRIVNPNGSVVFEMTDIQAPEGWSQVAVDILAQKYFRKAGVPAKTERVAETGVPEWLRRSVPANEVSGRVVNGKD